MPAREERNNHRIQLDLSGTKAPERFDEIRSSEAYRAMTEAAGDFAVGNEDVETFLRSIFGDQLPPKEVVDIWVNDFKASMGNVAQGTSESTQRVYERQRWKDERQTLIRELGSLEGLQGPEVTSGEAVVPEKAAPQGLERESRKRSQAIYTALTREYLTGLNRADLDQIFLQGTPENWPDNFKTLAKLPEWQATVEKFLRHIDNGPDPATDWLQTNVSSKLYAKLEGKERVKADFKFLQGTSGAFDHFFAGQKWELHEGSVRLKDAGDLDAKATLEVLHEAGLDQTLYVFLKHQQTRGTQARPGPEALDPKTPQLPGQKTSSAELMYRLLKAGDLYEQLKPRERAGLEVLVELSKRYVHNELYATPQEFLQSAKTLRGLWRFMSGREIVEYVGNNVEVGKLTRGKRLDPEQLKQVLDREFKEDELGYYSVLRLRPERVAENKITLKDYSLEQSKLIERAREILDHPDNTLREQGWLVNSPEWGSVFVNVARTHKESFPGGAAAVRAWRNQGAYLNLDLEGQSFLFRVLGKEQPGLFKHEPLPGGMWVNGMYLKPRDGKQLSFTPEEALRHLGIPQAEARALILKVEARLRAKEAKASQQPKQEAIALPATRSGMPEVVGEGVTPPEPAQAPEEKVRDTETEKTELLLRIKQLVAEEMQGIREWAEEQVTGGNYQSTPGKTPADEYKALMAEAVAGVKKRIYDNYGVEIDISPEGEVG